MKCPLAITGTGAVSPAGWGCTTLLEAIHSGASIACSELVRDIDGEILRTPVLRVSVEGATSPKFPRLRRTSPISKFAASAVAEALGAARLAEIAAGTLRVGVVFTVTNGSVNYSNRFFAEVLADSTMASPILFPETVFNAPSSHVSAMIGSAAPNDTLIGDSSGFLSGMDLAAEWLQRGEVDGCIVVCAEEIDWLSAEGLRLYSRSFIPSEGAAAIYLEHAKSPAQVLRLPDPVSLAFSSRNVAARKTRDRLGAEDDGETLLVDGCAGVPRFDKPEQMAWANWRGPRWSPRRILGEGMGVSSGLQVVAAVRALEEGTHRRAIVSAVGANQQAAGVLLGRI
ncbi:MAG: beta-ketoacyl synthase N-terminal-like domain-containing protein [Verrucomicrobiota bacterium]